MIERQRVAARLMAQGATLTQVTDALTSIEPDITTTACRTVYEFCLKAWRDTFEREIQYHRSAQLHRLHGDLVTMRAERKATKLPPGRKRASWNDIIKCEMAIARITGTLAAVKLEVHDPNAVLSESMSKILGEMTPEEQDALIAEGEALE